MYIYIHIVCVCVCVYVPILYILCVCVCVCVYYICRGPARRSLSPFSITLYMRDIHASTHIHTERERGGVEGGSGRREGEKGGRWREGEMDGGGGGGGVITLGSRVHCLCAGCRGGRAATVCVCVYVCVCVCVCACVCNINVPSHEKDKRADEEKRRQPRPRRLLHRNSEKSKILKCPVHSV